MSEASTLLRRTVQSVTNLLYPVTCVLCDARVEGTGMLCATCWTQTPFCLGTRCDLCGMPLPGEDPGYPIHCDDCLAIARPWSRGRAALVYQGKARDLVLALKHADQTPLARPAARWMAQAAGPTLPAEALVVPVPVHWTRLVHRRYSQSALLATELARATGRTCAVEALIRPVRTPMLDGLTRNSRFAALDEAIRPHPRHGGVLGGRHVVLVDDVMTSGATLAASAEAARAGGAAEVTVLVLARVAKDGGVPIFG